MDAKELPARPSLEQYKKLAKELVKACKSGAPEAIRAIRTRYPEAARFTDDELIQYIKQRHPRLAKLPDSEIRSAKFALADAQFVIAREHGFESWPKFAKYIEAVNQKRSPVSQFESAADAVITGDVATLESLLRENPELIRERSTRAHRATLFYYVAANAVEGYRQKTPKNAVEVAKLLLSAGAEADAVAGGHGGVASTTMVALVSSCHPAEAGVQADLVETLLDFGAAINGVEDDGAPLITALAFCYTDAAEVLARRGARVDNIVVAAGLGREDLVRSFINADGRLKADVPLVDLSWLRLPKDPKAYLELALVWANMHGRTGVVEFLLQQGVAPDARDNWGKPLLPAPSLEPYEALAKDMVAAYTSGEAAAMRRIWSYFQVERLPTWEEFRQGVRERLGTRADAENANADLTLADAQFLVARSHGFESWAQLAKHIDG